jgi:hypothetical protein
MQKNLFICLGIFTSLAASRFIPHPPNFTSLIALSFYVPVLLGLRFLPALIISFAITDLVIGYHSGTHWTWGSVLVIGLMSQYFGKNINLRLIGSLFGASIFFLITNFGVWTSGYYGLNLNGLIESYFFAIPFFGYTILSTLIFSVIIETIYKIYSANFEKYFKLNKR